MAAQETVLSAVVLSLWACQSRCVGAELLSVREKRCFLTRCLLRASACVQISFLLRGGVNVFGDVEYKLTKLPRGPSCHGNPPEARSTGQSAAVLGH